MKRLIIANWKMTPQTAKEAEEVFDGIQSSAPKLKNAEVIICPPFVYLDRFSGGRRIKLGAQDAFWENPPAGGAAYTGEISPAMLKSAGVKYVIIGHSERRQHLNETDGMINRKIKTALKNNLKVIFCVGEKERDEAGDYLKFVKKEIHEGLNKIPRKNLKNLIIAYEPIWAISSSKGARADTPDDLFQMTIYIRRTLFFKFGRKVSKETPILYGGSVNAGNARDFLDNGNVQGFLVGRASWKAKTFVELLKSI